MCLQFSLECLPLLAVEAGLLASPSIEGRGGLLHGCIPGAPVQPDRIEVWIEPNQFCDAGVDLPHPVLAPRKLSLGVSDVPFEATRLPLRFARQARCGIG